MAAPQQPTINLQTYQEAAEWLVLFREDEADVADQRRFERWLRKSPECVRAYLEVAAIWKQGAQLDPERTYDVDTLIAQGRQGAGQVVPLLRDGVATGVSRASPVRNSWPQQRWLATAASVLIVICALGAWVWMQRAPVFATMVGEQRSLMLADGSQVVLNSKSKIRVSLGEHERNVQLLSGQALFTVAKDPERPFIVSSGNTRVRAVGTQFDVYRKAQGTVVTVLEGRVAVSGGNMAALPERNDGTRSTASSARQLLLSAGEQLIVSADQMPQQVKPDVAVVTAWTERQLVFKGARLADVADEFNRYNRMQLAIDDRQLQDFLISGIFSSTNPDSLLNFLRMQPGFSVQQQGSQIVVTRKSRTR